MSSPGHDGGPSTAAKIISLTSLYENILEEMQLLLDGTHHDWTSEDEILTDDLLVQLLVWGVDLDVESGTLQWVQQNCTNESVVVEGNLQLIWADLTHLKSLISTDDPVIHGNEAIGQALNRLASNVRNLCDLSNALQIAISLRKNEGSVAEVNKYMRRWSLESSRTDAGPTVPHIIAEPEIASKPASGQEGDSESLQSEFSDEEDIVYESDPRDLEELLQGTPDAKDPPGSPCRGYVRIYALLTLLEKADQLSDFIKEGIRDEVLPLVFHPRHGTVSRKDQGAVSSFQGWSRLEKDSFDRLQWGFIVPFLEFGPNLAPQTYSFDKQAIVPWVQEGATSMPRANQTSTGHPGAFSDMNPKPPVLGGYSDVKCVRINRYSHGFREPLLQRGLDDTLFDLLMVHSAHSAEEGFHMQLRQLELIGSSMHEHLITLLASITLNGKYAFLFPHAECNLLEFWSELHPWPPPPEDIAEARWLAKQLQGLAGAVDAIHNPKSQAKPGRMHQYHGSIGPENILCFRSLRDPRGVLVLTDCGVSSYEPKNGPSNTSNNRVPLTSGYYPPGYMYETQPDSMSQVWDVWTLGWLFFDLVTWFLGGVEYVSEFERQRTSWHVQTPGSMPQALFEPKVQFQLVSGIKNWTNKLHSHPNCTPFIHDTLNIIENEILVVTPAHGVIASSTQLRQAFDNIRFKCKNETAAESYFLIASPQRPVDRAAETEGAPTDPAFKMSQEGRNRRRMQKASPGDISFGGAALPSANMVIRFADAVPDSVRQSPGQLWFRSTTESDAVPCAFHVTVNDSAECEILDDSRQKIRMIPTIPISNPLAEHSILGVLQHLAQFKYFEGIENRLPNHAFEGTFSAVSSTGDSAVLGSTMIEVEHDSAWALHISNGSADPLYMTIFVLSTTWKVSNFRNNGSMEIRPKSHNKVILKMFVPEVLRGQGETTCNDIVKVFMTSEPPTRNFHAQLLGDIRCHFDSDLEEATCDHDNLEMFLADLTRPSRSGDEPQSWATRNFVVRTSMRKPEV